ncbi:hypothetical protein HUA74_13940 [Myxococcus sp. CA051A]|uniref:DUF4337 domain-containing protein n=1 Tax=Myxococcus llanfairpwllgwyngyllgogerychwyrndrobwllllantysiliogogogochensis TaxID=2590453 RepID=A0A540WSG3_9BACT|nr:MULTISPECIES: hypothetical protein [Myxococcus]NTX13299.1 hypothetical protein [Myxococcus sp. CA056]NTX61759.1 hypothetical protein [Myxococcus sp. CA051A]TQF11958.1 hypothetical protein FJV41_31545 [Myxococcus llanfairpwllgwyngyllgogerychwyrndrobwllllantysiliogogogochensis]
MDTPATVPPELKKEIADALLHLRPAHERRREYVLELLATVLLALATVGSAWTAYQSTRWSGDQSFQYSKANALRAESVRASTTMALLVEIDTSLFESWADAWTDGDSQRLDFYERRFREEFRPAFEAWRAEATRPGEAPEGTPFTRPEYHPATLDKSRELAAEAEKAFEQARQSNQNGDNFTFCVVLFASVLFFAGVSTKLLHPSLKIALLALAGVMMVVATLYMFSLPQNIGFRIQ